MPITRRTRERTNNPLSPIDLDPWKSNTPRSQEPNQVAQENNVSGFGSNLSSLTQMSSQFNEDGSAQTHQDEENRSMSFDQSQGDREVSPDDPQTPSPSPSPTHTSPSSPPRNRRRTEGPSDSPDLSFYTNKSLPNTPRKAIKTRRAIVPQIIEPAVIKQNNEPLQKFSKEDKLTTAGGNYNSWKQMTELFLETAELIDIVQGDEPEPEEQDGLLARSAWRKKDVKAKSQLALNMEMGLYGELNAGKGKTSAQLWSEINSRFAQTSVAAQTAAKAKLQVKRMGLNEDIHAHIRNMRKLKGDLISVGGDIPEPEWLTILSASISEHPSWNTAVLFGQNATKGEDFISALVMLSTGGYGKFLPAGTSNTQSTETALQSGSNSRPRSRNNSRNSDNNQPKDVCTNCNRPYHTIKNCWEPGGGAVHKRPDWYKPSQPKNEHAHIAGVEDLEKKLKDVDKQRADLSKQISEMKSTSRTEHARVATTSNKRKELALITIEGKSNLNEGFISFIIDSGATSHMTNDRSILSSFENVEPVAVETAKRGDRMYASGKGTISAVTSYTNEDGETHETDLKLYDVLYVPDLAYNLLSTLKLGEKGVEVNLLPTFCTLKDDGVFFAKGKIHDKHYLLEMDVKKEQAYLTSTKAESNQPLNVWHQRFGHMGTDRIRELERDHLVTGLHITSTAVAPCDTCVVNKLTASHTKSKTELRAQGPCEILHADLAFIGKKSFSGADISLKFVDEDSNYVWVYAIRNKESSTIFEIYTHLVVTIDTQFSVKVKALHTDNGGEFVNDAMRAFNKSKGIEHHTTVPYRHEMNGRAERLNRTASNAVRSIIYHADIPWVYWAEAQEFWAYVFNRTGTSSKDNRTPYHVLYGKPPAVDHIRTFGSVAYVKVMDELRKKMDPKAVKMIFVGYHFDAAFRMLDPVSHKVTITRDAVFDEFKSFIHRPLTPVSHEPQDDISEIEDLSEHVPELRRSSRLAKQTPGADSERVQIAHRVIAGVPIPRSVKEARKSNESEEWEEATKYEKDKLEDMDCWDVVERPPNVHVLPGLLVRNVKQKADGSKEFRVRYVVRGDKQIKDLEYGETFAVSGDFVSAKTVIALSSSKDWSLVTLDISSAYLYSPLKDHEIYIEYPPGFTVPGFTDPVCKLKKSVYGLKQGGHDFNGHFTDEMATMDFVPLVSAPTVYYRSTAEGETIAASHVDDVTAACRSSADNDESKTFREDIGSKFNFKEKDTSVPAIVLGMNVHRNKKEGHSKIHVGQKVANLVIDYRMTDVKPVRTPMVQDYFNILDNDHTEPPKIPPWPYSKLVGELLWISTVVRPDITFAVGVLSRFLEKPKQVHWDAAKRVISYLAGTKELGLIYRFDGDETPVAFSDSDWAGDRSDRKSVSGYVVMLKGGPIQWKSRKQGVVAKSTAEAEYIAASTCAQELKWFRNFFGEINREFSEPLLMNVDNQAAIQMAKNPVYLSKTKHIDIHVHYIRDEVKKGNIRLQHVDGKLNPADIFTKPLAAPAHEKCVALLGMA